MLPPFVPLRAEIILYTGWLEILGAIGVWIPGLTGVVGTFLVVMLIGLLPANIYSAFARVPFGGHDLGPIYLVARVPFQLLVMGWVYHATGQRWLDQLHGRRWQGRKGGGDFAAASYEWPSYEGDGDNVKRPSRLAGPCIDPESRAGVTELLTRDVRIGSRTSIESRRSDARISANEILGRIVDRLLVV